MGRRDAVQFTLEWAAEARRLGAIVDFEPGFEFAGNGTSADYEGGVVHHTAFLSSEGNPFPAKSTLKNGRSDLPGPLCNVAGPWCEDGAPRLVVVAAHPANHAGASGGRSMGPLPVTSLFNPRVFGLEIDYGGVIPMTKGQRKAATIFGRALVNVLARSPEWVRAHAETSITGKWDPGFAPDQTIDMAEFRQGISNFAAQEDPFMALTDSQQATLAQDAALARYAAVNLLKPTVDALLAISQEEDAQTDRLEFMLGDEQNGVRAQLARMEARDLVRDAAAGAGPDGVDMAQVNEIIDQTISRHMAAFGEQLSQAAAARQAKVETIAKLATVVADASEKLATATPTAA